MHTKEKAASVQVSPSKRAALFCPCSEGTVAWSVIRASHFLEDRLREHGKQSEFFSDKAAPMALALLQRILESKYFEIVEKFG